MHWGFTFIVCPTSPSSLIWSSWWDLAWQYDLIFIWTFKALFNAQSTFSFPSSRSPRRMFSHGGRFHPPPRLLFWGLITNISEGIIARDFMCFSPVSSLPSKMIFQQPLPRTDDTTSPKRGFVCLLSFVCEPMATNFLDIKYLNEKWNTNDKILSKCELGHKLSTYKTFMPFDLNPLSKKFVKWGYVLTKKHKIANMRSLKMEYLWLNKAESSSQFQPDRARTWALRPMFVWSQRIW